MTVVSGFSIFTYVKEIIKSVRNIRATMNVVPSRKASLIFVTENDKIINEGAGFIEKLAYADKIMIQKDKEGNNRWNRKAKLKKL